VARPAAVTTDRRAMRSLASVVRREAGRLRRLPALWALLLPIPVAATLLLIGVLNSEVARELPVAVLDLDRTPAAQTATRWLEATRSARVTAHIDDLGAARALLLEGTVYAVLVVPRHFERDLLRGRSPLA
jgi:ABC-2 type transport system permease protein